MAELQLAGAMSRLRWAAGRLAIPVVGTAVLLVIGGALFGGAYGASIGETGHVGSLALAALAYWPAVMVILGVAVALFGWLPRAAVVGPWAALGAMWVIVIAGDALHLPSWVLDALPFSATPYQPAEPFSWTPLLILTVVAGALVASGLTRYARRDVQLA